MRSGVLAAVIACAVGCSAPGGIEFELDATADPTADAIAVYVGGGMGTNASIARRGKQPNLSANDGTFFPDAHGTIEIFELGAGSRTKTLSLVPGGGDSIISIVAVGMTGDTPTSVATLTTVPLGPDVILVWKVVLEPLTAARSVALWGEDPEDKTCVQVTSGAGDMPRLKNLYIGNDGDRDCDGFPEKVNGARNKAECDDDWYGAKQRPTPSTLSCLKTLDVVDSGTTTTACVVGGPNCEDGKPDERTECSLVKPFCAPAGLCASCMQPDPEERLACALALHPLQGTTSIAHVSCSLELNTTAIPNRMCDTPNRVGPPTGWFGPTVPTCLGPPMFHTQDRAAPWSSTAEVGGVALTFSNAASPGSCGFQVTSALSTMHPLDPGAFPTHGLVAVELASGRGIVAPITFEIVEVPQCTNINRDCTITPTTADGSIQNCLANAPADL